ATFGIYALEPDVMLPGRTMAGVGRNLLFEVMGPTPQVRLVVDMTATLKGDGMNLLPPAAAIGDERTALPSEGRGSGRVFSAALTPQVINGRSYVAVDMNDDGKRFAEDRTGISGLYGSGIPFEDRKSVV